MAIPEQTRSLMQSYPRIYFACHTRHVPDPESGRVLSARQASILDHLDDRQATSLTDLAKHMGVTPATMSVAVDRLVAQGYVIRTRDAADARRVRLRVSAAGLRLRESKTVLDPERVTAMLRRLSAAERREALHGLTLLARAAQEAMHEHSRRGAWSRRSGAAGRRGKGGGR